MKEPFLWSFISDISNSESLTGGQERVRTGSLAEENRHAVTKFD